MVDRRRRAQRTATDKTSEPESETPALRRAFLRTHGRRAELQRAQRRAFVLPDRDERRVPADVIRPMSGAATPPLGAQRTFEMPDDVTPSRGREIGGLNGPDRQQPREFSASLLIALRRARRRCACSLG